MHHGRPDDLKCLDDLTICPQCNADVCRLTTTRRRSARALKKLSGASRSSFFASIVINLRMEDRLAHAGQTTPPTRLNAIFRKR